ncbi:MAG: Rab family GTPase [Bryobacteraceae bacterium]
MHPLQKKICMAGSFAVGKTSLVRRYVESIFDERYQTTIGVKIDKKQVTVDGQSISMVLWDLAGEDELAQLRSSHLRGASGIILVADGCRSNTLDKAVSLQERIIRETGDIPFVLAVNKADLQGNWQIKDEALAGLLAMGWTCLKTSARDGQGVDDLFRGLARKMLGRKE